MPLIIPKELPAYDELSRENVFVMHRERAQSQNIRPLRILILNLMPTKIVTETQLARLLANSPAAGADHPAEDHHPRHHPHLGRNTCRPSTRPSTRSRRSVLTA